MASTSYANGSASYPSAHCSIAINGSILDIAIVCCTIITAYHVQVAIASYAGMISSNSRERCRCHP